MLDNDNDDAGIAQNASAAVAGYDPRSEFADFSPPAAGSTFPKSL
jgi:hypothetical protein